MKEFHGKRVVITGAAEGVGQMIAQQFAMHGARLVIVDIQQPSHTVH
ncbi:MAG: SDR family NAD(P)-dependent oxidoreductase, partial [Lentisphaerae bacterium]|nr:SDR family NAD(P)-dependent oxidoreductase [Lentisphaerota bacterium]